MGGSEGQYQQERFLLPPSRRDFSGEGKKKHASSGTNLGKITLFITLKHVLYHHGTICISIAIALLHRPIVSSGLLSSFLSPPPQKKKVEEAKRKMPCLGKQDTHAPRSGSAVVAITLVLYDPKSGGREGRRRNIRSRLEGVS